LRIGQWPEKGWKLILETPQKVAGTRVWPAALSIGVLLSIGWTILIVLYLSMSFVNDRNEVVSQFQIFRNSSPNNFGDSLAGMFAPLAFLWLVVATFLQKEELVAQREELIQSRKALELQAAELKSSVAQLTQQTEVFTNAHKCEQLAAAQKSIDEQINDLATFCGHSFSNIYYLVKHPGSNELVVRLCQNINAEDTMRLGETEMLKTAATKVQYFLNTINQLPAEAKVVRFVGQTPLQRASARCAAILELAKNIEQSPVAWRVDTLDLPGLKTNLDLLILKFESFEH
jgi:hypothetical protein